MSLDKFLIKTKPIHFLGQKVSLFQPMGQMHLKRAGLKPG